MSDLTGIDPVLANTDLVNRNIIFSVKDATPTQKGVDVKRISGDGTFFGQALMWNDITWAPRSLAGYYRIDPINGEDNPLSPGDDTHPFKTINYAMGRISPVNMSQYTQIYLNDGIYHENIVDKVVTPNVAIKGNSSDNSLVVIAGNPDMSSPILSTGLSNGHVSFQNLTVKPSGSYTSASAVYATQNTYLALSNVNIDLTGASGFNAFLVSQNNAYMDVEGSTTVRGNANDLFYVINNGSMIVGAEGITIVGNATYGNLLYIDMNGKMYISGNITNTGVLNGKKYDVRNNGDLAGVTKLPTSNLTAGTVAAGGRAN